MEPESTNSNLTDEETAAVETLNLALANLAQNIIPLLILRNRILEGSRSNLVITKIAASTAQKFLPEMEKLHQLTHLDEAAIQFTDGVYGKGYRNLLLEIGRETDNGKPFTMELVRSLAHKFQLPF